MYSTSAFLHSLTFSLLSIIILLLFQKISCTLILPEDTSLCTFLHPSSKIFFQSFFCWRKILSHHRLTSPTPSVSRSYNPHLSIITMGASLCNQIFTILDICWQFEYPSCMYVYSRGLKLSRVSLEYYEDGELCEQCCRREGDVI